MQHVTSNNDGSCRSTLLRPFARSLRYAALQIGHEDDTLTFQVDDSYPLAADHLTTVSLSFRPERSFSTTKLNSGQW